MKFNKLIIFSVLTLSISSEMYAPPAARPTSQAPVKPTKPSVNTPPTGRPPLPNAQRSASGRFQQVKPSGPTPTQSLSPKFQDGMRLGSKPNQTAPTTKNTQSIQLDQSAQKPVKTTAATSNIVAENKANVLSEVKETVKKRESGKTIKEAKQEIKIEKQWNKNIEISKQQKNQNVQLDQSVKTTPKQESFQLKQSTLQPTPKAPATPKTFLEKLKSSSEASGKHYDKIQTQVNTKATNQSGDVFSPTSTSTTPVKKTTLGSQSKLTVEAKLKDFYNNLKNEYNVLKAKVTGKDVVTNKTLSDGTVKTTTTTADGTSTRVMNKKITQSDGTTIENTKTTLKDPKVSGETWTTDTTKTKKADGTTVEKTSEIGVDKANKRIEVSDINTIKRPDGSQIKKVEVKNSKGEVVSMEAQITKKVDVVTPEGKIQKTNQVEKIDILKNAKELGLDPANLTSSSIKKAYVEKSRETHPDKKGPNSSKENFQKVNEANVNLKSVNEFSLFS